MTTFTALFPALKVLGLKKTLLLSLEIAWDRFTLLMNRLQAHSYAGFLLTLIGVGIPLTLLAAILEGLWDCCKATARIYQELRYEFPTKADWERMRPDVEAMVARKRAKTIQDYLNDEDELRPIA